MAYNFIDTMETSDGAFLPSEALQINGEFIEDLIDGYRTLNVTGREALSAELDTYTVGVRDGAYIKSKRYPARTITVKYQLIAESNEAFREAYNQLAKILNVENAQLIFNDETDKFFTGTPEAIEPVNAGRNSVIGEFKIFCADPFKYSVIEYEATPSPYDDGSILIDYNGTYKSYPTLEVDFFEESEVDDENDNIIALSGAGDCGYVAFFNENEKIIQLGDPKEADGESYPRSQTLINQKFDKSSSWGVAAKDLWNAEAGELYMKAASYDYTEAPDTSGTLLSNQKSDDGSPTIYYTVKAKATDRTANTVKVKVTVTAAMSKSSSTLDKKRTLKGEIKFGDSDWFTINIKKSSDQWKGTSAHTVTKTVTIYDLTADQTALTNIKFKVERTDDDGDGGTLNEIRCADLKISKYTAPVPATYYLSPKSSTGSSWHGAAITRNIPADEAGDVGASNFKLTYRIKTSIGKSDKDINQLGMFKMQVIASNNKVLAEACIKKNLAGKKAYFCCYVMDKAVSSESLRDLSYHNKYVGNNNDVKGTKTVKTCGIEKTGNKIEFNIGGYKKTLKLDSAKDVKAAKIRVCFYQYGDKPALAHNGLYYVKFIKNKCDTWEDIPNKFSANDIVEANCKTGEVFLNDTLTPALGALGNDWEEFYLTTGLNQIGFSYSDWVNDFVPQFKVRYREVFL